jgi:hypothetical protein
MNNNENELDEILARDPVAEVEQALGRGTAKIAHNVVLGHAMRVNDLKRKALKAAGDTSMGMPLESYLTIVGNLGFERVFQLQFTEKDHLNIYWRDDGLLLVFDSLSTKSSSMVAGILSSLAC